MKLLSLIFLNLTCFNFIYAEEFQSTVGLIVSRDNEKTVCSGALISPNIVLTSGHCLVDVKSIRVINEESISKLQYLGITGHKYKAKHLYIHPKYNGTEPDSVDIGLIILNKNVDENINFSHVIYDFDNFVHKNTKLIRVGYGLRDRENLRTVINVTFSHSNHDFGVTKDLNAVGGDSGGPVYFKYKGINFLFGVHSGILLDNGKNTNNSYMELIDYSKWVWIDKIVQIYN